MKLAAQQVFDFTSVVVVTGKLEMNIRMYEFTDSFYKKAHSPHDISHLLGCLTGEVSARWPRANGRPPYPEFPVK